jgi:hypothetical protein
VEEAPTVLEVEQALDDMVLRSGARVANASPVQAEGDPSLGAAGDMPPLAASVRGVLLNDDAAPGHNNDKGCSR